MESPVAAPDHGPVLGVPVARPVTARLGGAAPAATACCMRLRVATSDAAAAAASDADAARRLQHVLLTVAPPETGPRPRLDVCVVVDTSYSMSEPANAAGAEEVRLFSKMDLARRAALVVARALCADDTLTLLSFSNGVEKRLARTHMHAAGLAAAERAIETLQPQLGTNLWGGLVHGLESVEDVHPPPPDCDGNDSVRHGVVLLLTDGHPTCSPPEGELAAMQRYLAQRDGAAAELQGRPRAKLVTMGFGYDLNTKLLVDLATAHRAGESDYAFVPDGTMVLTNFVNLMANLRSTCARRMVLHITPPAPPSSAAAPDAGAALASAMDAAFTTGLSAPSPPDASRTVAGVPVARTCHGVDLTRLVKPMGGAVWRPLPTAHGVGVTVVLGDVQYGQELHALLTEVSPGSASGWANWGLQLEYEPLVPGVEAYDCTVDAAADANAMLRQIYRCRAVEAVQTAHRRGAVDLPGALGAVRDATLATLAAADACDSFVPHPILEDLMGQVSEALGSAEAWSRWGAHYLPSLLAAHRAQACNNFKDPGVLAYRSAHVEAVQAELNVLCDTLPAAVPSIRAAGRSATQCRAPVSTARFNAAFNNRHGGCFGAGSRVALPGGRTAAIEQLRAGDAVALPGGGAASVRCVVAYGGAAAVRLPGSGLVITPWHPVRVGGRWCFPADLASGAAAAAATAAVGTATGRAVPNADAALSSMLVSPGRVYNLVLDGGHVVMVNGIEAVTLGHGLQDEIARHPYFGSDAVVRDLEALPGWQCGWVNLDLLDGSVEIELDVATGLVAGMRSMHGMRAAPSEPPGVFAG